MHRVPKPPSSARRCPLDVFRYHDYRAFLADYYALRKTRKGFSYRAFSREAGLGAPNYLQLVITKKRNLTGEMAERFAAACGLGREATSYFGVLVTFNQATTVEARNAAYQRLTHFRRYRQAQKLELAHAAYHSTWYIPAIRELMLSEHFRDDIHWIAAALWPPIKSAEAQQALDTLLALGMVKRSESGALQPTARVVSTGAETTGMHIVNYHLQALERAAAALVQIPAAQRDISSLTLCASPQALLRIKERLQGLRRELIELCESDPASSQVLQVNLQLYPLTHDVAQPPAPRPGPKGQTKKH